MSTKPKAAAPRLTLSALEAVMQEVAERERALEEATLEDNQSNRALGAAQTRRSNAAHKKREAQLALAATHQALTLLGGRDTIDPAALHSHLEYVRDAWRQQHQLEPSDFWTAKRYAELHQLLEPGEPVEARA